MQKIHFSIYIDAPTEKVWNTMLEDTTYRVWTKAFEPGPDESGSYFEGSWEEGSEIKFLAGDSGMGMFSRIKENRLYEYVSIEHIGMIKDGIVDTTSDEVKKWVPAFENYTFADKDGGTEVSIDMDINDEYRDMFLVMWPRALQSLKELAEK